MIQDNVIFWQAIIFVAFGFLTATMCNAMVGVPKRIIESM